MPTSPPTAIQTPMVEIIDVDAVAAPVANDMCHGYIFPVPDGCTPHSLYPFALHDHLSLPWDYSIVGHVLTLRARSCEVPNSIENICLPCRNLENNSVVLGIVKRMNEGVRESTNYMYHGFGTLTALVGRRNNQIRYLQLHGLNQARRLLVQTEALSDYKRFTLAIASGRYEHVDRLVRIALQQKRGIRGIITMYEAAATGVYQPRSYTERDDMRALLLGNRIAQIAHRALNLPGLTTIRRRSIMPHIIPSSQKPTVDEIQKNTVATFESIQEFLDGQQVVHQVLMFDEIATEKRVRWDHQTNMFLGICREHGSKTSLEFISEHDMEELFCCIDSGEVHEAAEATIGALGLLTDNHRLYPARPILISGDCKKETGREHAQVLQTVLDAVNLTKPSTHLRIVSIASDGETRRGTSFVQLTFKKELSPSSKIYPLVSCLPLMNFHVGDDDMTADKDWKHIFKRFRNLLLRTRGIVIMGIRITPSIIRLHLQEAGCTAVHLNAVFNPEDSQDVKLAFDLLKDIWNLPPASESRTPTFQASRDALRLLGRLLHHMVFPYICVDFSLSEQVEHLSGAIHLALALYHTSQKQFIPTLLYLDLAIMVKNVIFCIAKAKVDSPDSSFWIMLLGTDRLEELFGVLRTMVGTDANLDILQLGDRITGTIEVLNILAKYPEWDRAPRRLKLPPLTRDSSKLPDTTDHIKPGSWRGDVRVKNISLQTSWKRGRRLIESEHPQIALVLKEIDNLPGANILAPMGKLLVNTPLDDDDIDESFDITEVSPLHNEDSSSNPAEDARLDIEDSIADQSNLSPKTFNGFVTINGKQIPKSRALSLRSTYNKKASSTDRLKRVQEIERYSQTPSIENTLGNSLFGATCLMVQDPIATLLVCEGRAWLCIGEVNNILHDSKSVESIPLEILYEGTVSISFQLLGLRAATSDDDPTLQYDWRSFRSSTEKTCTIPGRLIEPIDVDTNLSIARQSFYSFKSSNLVAKSAILFERLKTEIKKLAVIKRTKYFPYREASGESPSSANKTIKLIECTYYTGKACFLCSTTLEVEDIASGIADICSLCSPEYPLDRMQPQRIFAHIGAHILYDKTVNREEEPCGLCLRPSLICKIYLKKGKGSKGGLKIDKLRSTCQMKDLKFLYTVAATSKESSPCSNVPIICPLCPKAAASVFKYNWKAHYANHHPHATYTNYASFGRLSKSETDEMKKVWKDRRKIPTKRVLKKKSLPPLEVSTAHSSGGVLDITSMAATDEPDNRGEVSKAYIEGESSEDEPSWDSDNRDGIEEDEDHENWYASEGDVDVEGVDGGISSDEEEDDKGMSDDGPKDPSNETHIIALDVQEEPTTLIELQDEPGPLIPSASDSNPNVHEDPEDPPVNGRLRRKRKAQEVIEEGFQQCLCGESAVSSEDVIICKNRGCETRVTLYRVTGHARHAQHRRREDVDE
ncbi:hypothetical protein H0H93_012840 [Arthromyces matolae]|nr:hypothetical protein H0H93_012840 [Arthromyces matolae]